MAIRMLGDDGKLTRLIPLANGYFEIILPSKLFADNPKSNTFHWVDFYRQ